MKLTSRHISIADVKEFNLGQNKAQEGHLVVAQALEHVPFKIERIFFVKPSGLGVERGHHAHRALSQFLVCVSGQIEVTVSDGIAQKTYILTDSSRGLLVPPDIFCSQKYLTDNATLLVLCDKPFSESDYIRDYDQFVAYVQAKRKILDSDIIKLNLGCGGRPLEDYINVDMDSLDQIRARYPNRHYSDSIVVVDYDIFNLPFADDTVDEIRSEALIEHLPFIDEPKFFSEVARVLKPGGSLYLTTVDFEKACERWLQADDNWQDFYRDDKEAIMQEHWFGTYSYKANNRWGYLTATFYGSQNGAGQFHTNCYSEAKFRAICKKLNLEVQKIERFQWQGDRDHMIALTAVKPSK